MLKQDDPHNESKVTDAHKTAPDLLNPSRSLGSDEHNLSGQIFVSHDTTNKSEERLTFTKVS